MTNEAFWKLDHRSNEQLVTGLDTIVRSCRQRTAELVAHLAEVEARRLHLEMAYSSLFDYCVRRLGLSEDEACRRIDVARLARRVPGLFPRLASGEISLTVVALLKPYLTDENQDQLLASVCWQVDSASARGVGGIVSKAGCCTERTNATRAHHRCAGPLCHTLVSGPR
jgi:hypothetical protein